MSLKLNLENDRACVRSQPSQTPKIDKLPGGVLNLIFSNLNRYELQTTALVNRRMSLSVETFGFYNQFGLARDFAQTLIQSPIMTIYPNQVDLLQQIAERAKHLEGAELPVLKASFPTIRYNLVLALAQLGPLAAKNLRINMLEQSDKATAKTLRNKLELHRFAVDIFTLANFKREISQTCEIKDEFSRAMALRDISAKVAIAGYFDFAFHIVSQIPLINLKMHGFQILSQSLAKAGEFGRAIEVANLIFPKKERARAIEEASSTFYGTRRDVSFVDLSDKAFQDISECLARAGELERAIDVAKSSIVDLGIKAKAFQTVFQILADAGQFDRINQFASLVPDKHMKIEVLGAVFASLVSARHFEKAAEIPSVISSEEGVSESSKNRQLWIGCESLVALRQFDLALGVASLISNEHTKNVALLNISTALEKQRS